MLQRRVTGDAVRTSIGDWFAEQLTPEELREQAALVTGALGAPKLSDAERQTLEGNLDVLEQSAADRGIELPAAQAHRVRQVANTLATDLKAMGAMAKELAGVKNESDDYSGSPAIFHPRLEWAMDQLRWCTDVLHEALDRSAAQQFQAAGTRLTAAIAVSKAAAAYLAYVSVAIQTESHHPHFKTSLLRMKLEITYKAFNPLIVAIRTFEPSRFDASVTDLLKEVPTWSFDYSQLVEGIDEDIRARDRFMRWLGILQLAWLAFDIWMIPVAGSKGSSGGGGGPRVSAPAGGGAVAVAGGGVLAAAESLEALRRLIRLGIIRNPGLVKAATGGPLATPKPMEARAKGSGSTPKPPPTPKPDPNARVAPGVPSEAEDAIVRAYTRELATLREKRQQLHDIEAEVPRNTKKIGRAHASLASTQARLEEIETEAANATSGELFQHLTPLRQQRRVLTDASIHDLAKMPTGKRVMCDAVRNAPKKILGREFADIEREIGRAPKPIPADQAPGAGLPSGHQRLEWEYKDGSKILADKPRRLEQPRPYETAERPHIELHGPKGERLDGQGIAVPEGSAAAHITITDYALAMEKHLAPARAKKGK
jgi:hypothetical protein